MNKNLQHANELIHDKYKGNETYQVLIQGEDMINQMISQVAIAFNIPPLDLMFFNNSKEYDDYNNTIDHEPLYPEVIDNETQ